MVESFFKTRSTAALDVSLANFSRMATAVKSIRLCEDSAHKNAKMRRTSACFFIPLQGLERSRTAVEGLGILLVQGKRDVALFNDLLVLRGLHVHVTFA